MIRKEILGLCAFSGLMSGCVMRQPVVVHYDVANTNHLGEVSMSRGSYASNELQFTPLGRVWNMGTYGALGTIYGIPKGWQEGFNNSQTNSTFKKGFDGAMGALMGPFKGLYYGMDYGFNLDYNKGRSVEGHIFDTIEGLGTSLGNFITNSPSR